MDAISPPIRLDDEYDLRAITLPRDWAVDVEGGAVLYRPRHLTFTIECPTPPLSGLPPRTGVVARLAHVGDGANVLPLDELRRIGKNAIHAFIMESPIYNPPDDRGLPF